MKRIPLFGVGTKSASDIISRQRRLNVYVDQRADQNKASLVLRGTPGLTLFATLPKAPIRGLFDFHGALGVVAGNALYYVDQYGGYTFLSNFGPIFATGQVGLAFNETQVGIADGGNLWVYEFSGVTPVPPATINAIAEGITPLFGIAALSGN